MLYVSPFGAWVLGQTNSEIIGRKYDAWIPNLRLFNSFLSLTSTANLTTAQIQGNTIEALCGAVQSECKGSNQQYTSVENCIQTLSAKPFGDWDEVWQDSVICRELHVILARVDPEVSLVLDLYTQWEEPCINSRIWVSVEGLEPRPRKRSLWSDRTS